MPGWNALDAWKQRDIPNDAAIETIARRVSVFCGGCHEVHGIAPLLDASLQSWAQQKLSRPGVVLLSPFLMDLDGRDREELAHMRSSFDDLALDSYDELGRRYRAHEHLSLETNAGHPIITRLKNSRYRQSARLNSTEAGRERQFDAIPNALIQRLLWRLILGLFDCLPESMRNVPTLDVNIHQVSYRAATGPSVATPLGLHRDGEPFTAVVLFAQRDLVGGDTVIVSDERRLVLAHTLRQPLEAILLNDGAVMHEVTPVLQGRRDVLVIDYTPKVVDVPA